jgi:endonuclease YncB( thermonuclease family)
LIFLVLISTNIFAQITAKVVGIKDGDTVVILEKNNTQKTLRLAEVDCPESKQPFGKNAKLSSFTTLLM